MPEIITLLLPADTKLPVVMGAWSRIKGRTRARYTIEELALVLAFAGYWEAAGRLSKGYSCVNETMYKVQDYEADGGFS